MVSTVLKGSCYCRAVRFSIATKNAVPSMNCYCGLCRKTSGGSGACITLVGDATTFEVDGLQTVSIYRAEWEDGGKPVKGENLRHFCSRCGTHLWAWSPKNPGIIYPLAAAIDTPLPSPKKRKHYMLAHKPEWVQVPEGADDQQYPQMPDDE